MKNAHWVMTILLVTYLLFIMNLEVGSWDLNRTIGWGWEDSNLLKRKFALWMIFVTLALWLFKIKKIPWHKFTINIFLLITVLGIFFSTDYRFYDILSILLKVGIGFFVFMFWNARSHRSSVKEWKEDGPLDDI